MNSSKELMMLSEIRMVLRLALITMVAALPARATLLYGLERQAVNPGQPLAKLHIWTVDTVSREVRDLVAFDQPLMTSMGGIEFDDTGRLYWFGVEPYIVGLNQHPSISLHSIDLVTGVMSRVGTAFPGGAGRTVDGFAIVGNAGYTVRHETDGLTWTGRLYRIDLSNGAATPVGSGYAFGTPGQDLAQKTVGLASDGVSLYAAKWSGEVYQWDVTSGQIIRWIRTRAQHEQQSAQGIAARGYNLAFADGALWILGTSLFRIDLVTGEASKFEFPAGSPNLSGVFGSTSRDRRPFIPPVPPTPPVPSSNFVSFVGRSLIAGPSALGFTLSGDAYPTQRSVFAYAPIHLPHMSIINALRCVVRDDIGKGFVTAGIKRKLISTQAAAGQPEDVVQIGTSGPPGSFGVAELTATPGPALARVDNKTYGYYLQVEFGGLAPVTLPIVPPVQEPRLYFRGCVVDLQ